MPKNLNDWNSYGFEVVLVALTSMAFAICMAVIVLACHGSEGSLTLASSMLIAAGVAGSHIRSTMAAMRLKAEVQDNTIKTERNLTKTAEVSVQLEEARSDVAGRVDRVEKQANGNLEKLVAATAEANYAKGKAETLETVAAVMPEVVPAVAAKIKESS